jgi:hypothetical protein
MGRESERYTPGRPTVSATKNELQAALAGRIAHVLNAYARLTF